MAKQSWLKDISDLDPLRLPGWLWLVIGLFVTIVSSRLGMKFILFTIIGVLFLILGVFKLVSGYVTGKIVGAPEEEVVQRETKAGVAACHHCRRKVYSNQFFCHHCGAKLR